MMDGADDMHYRRVTAQSTRACALLDMRDDELTLGIDEFRLTCTPKNAQWQKRAYGSINVQKSEQWMKIVRMVNTH